MKGLFFGVGVTGVTLCQYFGRPEWCHWFLAVAMMPVGYYFFAILRTFAASAQGARGIPLTPEMARRLMGEDATQEPDKGDGQGPTGFRGPGR